MIEALPLAAFGFLFLQAGAVTAHELVLESFAVKRQR